MNDIVFYFEGIQRLDWGFGNPNKTATLIAELMVAVWVLALSRRNVLFYCAALLFTFLGCCLALTYSRGGFLACVAGLSLLLLFSSWPWTKGTRVVILLCLAVVLGYMIHIGASRRYVQGISETDNSIQNRIEIWKKAPQMMVNAPRGWGLGQSGLAYLQWYQPTERDQSYRTLVNSHLTWLVEFGWVGRYFYIAGWVVALVLCLIKRQQKLYPIPLGVWLVFAVSATFSSVAESLTLWMLPVVFLLGSLIVRIKTKQMITRTQWLFIVLLPLLVCLIFLIVGSTSNNPRIKKTREAIVVGSGVPETWLILDNKLKSTESWAQTLREYMHSKGNRFCLAIGDQIKALAPQAPERIVIWGRPSNIDSKGIYRFLPSSSHIVLYAPQFYPQEVAPELLERFRSAEVYFGEFSQSPFLYLWEKEVSVIRTPGMADYFSNWTELLSSGPQFGKP